MNGEKLKFFDCQILEEVVLVDRKKLLEISNAPGLKIWMKILRKLSWTKILEMFHLFATPSRTCIQTFFFLAKLW